MQITGTGLLIGVAIGLLILKYWQRPSTLGDTLFYAHTMDDPEDYVK